jgi:hypothetical protein
MGQLGFFDLNRRYENLTEKNDPLVAIAAMRRSAASLSKRADDLKLQPRRLAL